MRGEALDLAELRLTQAAEPVAFEQVLRLHERRVYLTALRLLGDRADAQDAAQEVFLKLHTHFREFQGSRDAAPWLYRVTVNVCRDALRKRRPVVALDESLASAEAPADDCAETGQRRGLLLAALGRLPERERAALVLRDIEGLATGEVAGVLGVTEATVRSQVSKARVRIRQLLKRHL